MAVASFSAWIGLFLLALPDAAAAGGLPITIEVPGACGPVDEGDGSWVCDYSTPDATGTRARRLLISAQDIPLKPDTLAYLKTQSSAQIGQLLQGEIEGIDERRYAERPEGQYERRYYRFLDDRTRPAGLASCARSMDVMTPSGSTETVTRSHLHCFAVDMKRGTAVQVLVSLLEFNDSSRAASPGLDGEFDGIVASISLSR